MQIQNENCWLVVLAIDNFQGNWLSPYLDSDILEKAEPLIGIGSLIIFFIEFPKRKGKEEEEKIKEAWEVITSIQDNKNAGSRCTKAVEYLCEKKVSLTGLQIPNTFLEKIYLKGANLSRANFKGANLSGANFKGADLSNANLSEANLTDANLSRANLKGADLSNATFFFTDLSKANLEKADLTETFFLSSNISGVILSFAVIHNTVFGHSNLSGARLESTNLNNATLDEVNLDGAYIIESYRYSFNNETLEKIKRAENWEKANYSKKLRKRLGLSPEE